MIIGLCGNQGSGKDTVGNILVSEYGFIKLSFATALKDVASILFSWPRDLLEGATQESRAWRETTNEYWSNKMGIEGFTPRKALQFIGTDLLRNQLYTDIWIDIIENKINMIFQSDPQAKIVITDCRFTNELNLIRKFKHTLIMKILRTNHIASQHSSETESLNYKFDITLENDSSLENLKTAVRYLMQT
jgi:dephospho-CoA kinase